MLINVENLRGAREALRAVESWATSVERPRYRIDDAVMHLREAKELLTSPIVVDESNSEIG